MLHDITKQLLKGVNIPLTKDNLKYIHADIDNLRKVALSFSTAQNKMECKRIKLKFTSDKEMHSLAKALNFCNGGAYYTCTLAKYDKWIKKLYFGKVDADCEADTIQEGLDKLINDNEEK